ncbi:hypothetical protein [Roseovarius sp.]|uniref:hypothetical protein n=1 Tax=Roseovarius sp. TaxID=1486281 RepID=UPI003A987569
MPNIPHMIAVILTALVIVTGFSGFAAASSKFGAHDHCVFPHSEQTQVLSAADDHMHGDGDVAPRHSLPNHDHETCTVHACSALFPAICNTGEPHSVLLTTLVWPEISMIGPAQTDDLQRPPRF